MSPLHSISEPYGPDSRLGYFTDASVGEGPSGLPKPRMRFATNIGQSPQLALAQTFTTQLKIFTVTRRAATVVHHLNWRIG